MADPGRRQQIIKAIKAIDRDKVKEILYITVAMSLILGFIMAWFHWYVGPRDRMMEATQKCVDERVDGTGDRWRYRAEKEAWGDCWDEQSKDKEWIWSAAPKPRKQGDPP